MTLSVLKRTGKRLFIHPCPGMLRKVMNVKAHAATGAPLAAFTATITEEELQSVQKAAGRKKPMLQGCILLPKIEFL